MKAPANTNQNVRLEPPMIEAQKTPLTSPATTTHPIGTSGSRKKLLKEIAKYSFRRTATQKTGSEKIKNDTKVIE
jgi:hypothetical protein